MADSNAHTPSHPSARLAGFLYPGECRRAHSRPACTRPACDCAPAHLAHTAAIGSRPEIPGWAYICKYESETPFVFRIGGRVLRFTMGGKDGQAIERSEELNLSSIDPSTTHWRCLYPAPVAKE